MTLIEIFTILIIHWFGDFCLQTDKQAKGKSKNWNDLLSHTVTYSLVWFLFCNAYSVITGNYMVVALFPIITFICHTITDYFTSRLNTYLWNKGDVHNFFVSIGFDQLLHYFQLFITYWYLTK